MSWDYVVVGGGSAGCVLANRLSADRRTRVLLLEAGGSDRHPFIHVPGLVQKACRISGIVWDYRAAPDESRNGAGGLWMAGRVIGGGSSINGVMWVRGHAGDFDGWAAQGCDGWDWQGVEPYFRRAERYIGGTPARGVKGPIQVRKVRAPHVITDAFVAAADASGHPYTDDYNGERQEGVGVGQANVRRGFRHSASRAHLRGAWRRRNLKVVTGAFVERVLLEGDRAVGVEYRWKGRLLTARASKEVVLSAGAIASPKLLMLSGVGPADHLRGHGINVVADVPGVGRNLQEHPVVSMLWNIDVPTFGMDFTLRGIVKHGFSFLRGRGPAAAGIFHAIMFSKLNADSSRTEVEAGFTPIALVGANAGDIKAETLSGSGTHDVRQMQVLDRATVTVYLSLLHPRSRGSVQLRSANPADPPLIQHEMFAEEGDLWDLVAGCRQVRQVFDTSPMSDHVTSEALPGADVTSDDEWEAFLRSQNCHGAMHPAGTCRMGTGPEAVVDPRLRAVGVQGLRVVDASVMPELTSGNTNAPTIMIAEKAAAMILEDADQ
ncbi:GMC family oxidoreductase [Parafrankia sp. BMG5.11]|uniref:GMC family oxidoreductase n=1 Tax=Parafrankia sp. BMG5.11 TaxID=222540 RepID=UPI00103C7A8E|nr:GMC family oxidoreductase N-terminal domain-containing protein [Parafrankia sp. BMG5.11]TCJ30983.1 glucose-methanol-choline oxidoreductase [Parafrankia sp. BMG5.11]